MNDPVVALAPISGPYVNELRQTHPNIAIAMAARLKWQVPDIMKQPTTPA